MAVYTKEYESQPEAILTNVIICPAVDLSANVAVPVHCQVENVLWDTGATNTLISQEVVNALGLQLKGERFVTDEELSRLLKISRRTLQEYRTARIIPYYLIQGKVLYMESEIQKFLEDSRKKCIGGQEWV